MQVQHPNMEKTHRASYNPLLSSSHCTYEQLASIGGAGLCLVSAAQNLLP